MEVKPQVSFITISAAQAGQRIDNFLFSQLKSVPKSLIYRALRKGNVRANKKRCKPTYRIQAGDEIRIPPFRTSDKEAPKPSDSLLKLLAEATLHEDDNLLILNKPSGVAVHAGSGLANGVIEAMRVLRPELDNLQLAHRLDRDTSGCLILCKNRDALLAIHELLIKSAIQKTYFTLVKGLWPEDLKKVDAPLIKNEEQSGERVVKVANNGKKALTFFKVMSANQQASLLEVDLQTGRTHQIRVHTQHAGHPVAADDKYGDRSFNKVMRKHGLKRLFLHAARLRFTMPASDQLIEVSAKLPVDLDNVLETLNLKGEQ